MSVRDPRAYLWDIKDSGNLIREFTLGLDATMYAQKALVTAAVERKFEVIGEALNQLSKVSPDLVQQIPDAGQIIAFRNQLIHGYAKIDHSTVWRIANVQLPVLIEVVTKILDDYQPQTPE